MTEIKITEQNGKFTAECPYCGKVFSYPYIGQTRNNVESHSKYCKYKPRNDEPQVQQPQVQTPPQTQEHPQQKDYENLLAFYNKYHQMIEALKAERIVP